MRKSIGLMSGGQQAGIPTQSGPSHFVIVTLGQRYFAIEADVVQGILDTPNAGARLVPTFRGDVYQVIDLAGRLAIGSVQEERVGQTLLLMRDHRRGSLEVERVRGRMDLRSSQILPLPPHFQGAERDWYHGVILFEGSVALILNMAWLFQIVPGIRQTED